MSKCFFCAGITKIKKVDVDFRWGNRLFVVKNVPVEVCEQCGERYYSSKVSKRLDKIVKIKGKSKLKTNKVIEVPVFNWQ